VTTKVAAVPPGPATKARAAGGGRRPRDTLLAQDRRFGYALVAPVVIVLLVITAFPLFYNVWNSVHNVDYLNPATFGSWAGLANYAKLFTDHQFVPAIVHTIGFTVVSEKRRQRVQ